MDIIESNANVLLYQLEQSDIVLLPNVGAIPLLRLLDSKFAESLLFICDDRKLEYISDYKLNDDLYRDLKHTGDVCWMSYDLVFHNLVKDIGFLKEYKVVVLDGLDRRTLISDLVCATIVNFKVDMQSCLVLLKSEYDLKLYDEFFGKNFTVSKLTLRSFTNVEFYYDQSDNYQKDIVRTLNTILKTDKSDAYDILVLLPFDRNLDFLKTFDISSTKYYIVQNIEDYTSASSENSRRIIFAKDGSAFVNFTKNSVKYVVDSGWTRVLIADTKNTSIYQEDLVPSSISSVQNNSFSILSSTTKETLKYFVLKDKSTLEKSHCEIKYGYNFLSYLPGLFKLLNDKNTELGNFTFLSGPDESMVRSSINQLIYLGILQLKPGFSGVQVTERGLILVRYHYTKSEEISNLFLALTYAKGSSVDSIMKIIACWSVLNHATLKKFLKDIRSSDEFLDLVELFDTFDSNPRIKFHFESHSFVKKELKLYYTKMNASYQENLTSNQFQYETLTEALVFGFQFKLCVVQDEDVQLITPISTSHESNTLQVRNTAFTNSEAIMVSKIHYYSSNVTEVDIPPPQSLIAKVPKRLLYDMKLPLIKMK